MGAASDHQNQLIAHQVQSYIPTDPQSGCVAAETPAGWLVARHVSVPADVCGWGSPNSERERESELQGGGWLCRQAFSQRSGREPLPEWLVP